MHRVRGTGLILTGLVVALLAAGCGRSAAADPAADLVHHNWPAAAAGGACQLLDYKVIAAEVGITFDTAGAGQHEETYTCALTQGDQNYPYLVLAVTATDADEVIFAATITPSGSTPVSGLGKVGYEVVNKASGKAGPQIEVGWLSGNQRLMLIRLTFPAGTSNTVVKANLPKMVELAKKIDQTIV